MIEKLLIPHCGPFPNFEQPTVEQKAQDKTPAHMEGVGGSPAGSQEEAMKPPSLVVSQDPTQDPEYLGLQAVMHALGGIPNPCWAARAAEHKPTKGMKGEGSPFPEQMNKSVKGCVSQAMSIVG